MIPPVAPLCSLCSRLRIEGGYDGPPATCAAFPQGIPDKIMIEGADHRHAIEGDNGIRFERAPGVTPAQVDAWAAQRTDALEDGRL